ncbi:hypothetical protein [Microvirga splendida]|uniref:Uncharacterized protein n=1 Tax=Microvirga splendida TaxID=2795727 RepID=A0ABS0XZC1_9HYPH|nr:hypothetical protein [Microvirga splendida]MBJ6125412.1 hypothetical protein [Microvirga splendida]
MAEEFEIFDGSREPPYTKEAILELTKAYGSGDGAKLAFQEKDGSLPPAVDLVFVLSNGDAFFAFNETFPDGLEAERDKNFGVLRSWKVEPTITRKDLAAALNGIVPTLDAIRKGATVVWENGKQKASLNEEALAAEASIGTIGKRA